MSRGLVVSLLLSGFVFIFYSPAYAHPGNTAADGCHYCRTNCASWGEVENERHCHNGGSVPVTTTSTTTTTTTTPLAPISQPVVAPVVATSVPTARPTIIPSPSPSLSPLPSPSPTPSPIPSPSPSPILQASPEVAGLTEDNEETDQLFGTPSAQPSPSPQSSTDEVTQDSPAATVGGLAFLGGMAVTSKWLLFGKKKELVSTEPMSLKN
jgi:hypothetical protein